ncbi:putative pyruvate decarboxylase C3G9.11c [Schizosaccharomyces pombe]|uniref:Putative pyruvate decarboxylase C3G9.11c n=1 Tax=Schizosaccharomyces pombe (strain 972 / ATCC 24843) TaxID=284812 RepID=PDC4_SCHPO|nr:putative pyruvate decarboxylase [Schizosaccharomyces pombe]O42873.1 RecName: Full=Putative pyruvate decarboxylase C3G9.11c [Schizosaccharomyces pombe 972h-]CAA15920.1 pyruvate decarboxylase (predicted) [Schizosaccharomyces pombe]|eukprot:NP_594083.1 putative pyruvate decarboxylase [Schizosaccharomyces pombe]
MSSEKVLVGEYLFTRLLQLGIKSILGVPGDFNLALLDLIEKVGDETFRWVGNENELNGAYAADAYARVKGISAIVTTFGVGELSALNGFAGAYSERIPVVHIVGVPNTKAQATRPLLHHTLGNGDFKVFQRMSSELSADVAFLDSGDSAGRLIDNLLETCVRTSRPVYLAVPSDAGYFYTDASPLKTPLVFPVPENNKEIEHEVVSEILELIEKSKNPSILVDACVSRFHIQQETQDFIDATHFPTYVTPMGKTAINESSPYFDGVYIGSLTEPSIKERAESTDLLLIIGGLRSDFNSGTFTYATPASQTIEFHSDYTKIRSGVYEGISMKHLLPKLTAAIDKKSVQAKARPVHFEPPKAVAAEGYAEGTITHKWFWPTFASFLRESDVVTTETGTSNFGILDCIFPKGCQNLSQVLWGSIGWSVGAMFGATLGIKDSDAPHRRSILIVGDGSLHLTVQEISATIRNGLTPIIFVINNKGYTIERLIHGLHAVYNDINTEWDYQNLLKGYGAKNSRSYNIHSEKELLDLFKDEEFGKADVIQLVEVHMPVLDAPRVLIEQAKLTASLNKQ